MHPKGVLISITYDEVLHRLKLLFDQGSTKVADTAEPQDEPARRYPLVTITLGANSQRERVTIE